MKIPDQEDSPWKANLTQSSLELVENLPTALASIALQPRSFITNVDDFLYIL